MSQLPRALGRLLPGWQAGGAGRGGVSGAWAAGTGRAQGRSVTEPPPATPARPAGADSPVSPGLSNCLAVQAPCPETAAGTGRGGVWWVPARSSVKLHPKPPSGTEARAAREGRQRVPGRPAPHAGVRAPARMSECGSSVGRWGARGAVPEQRGKSERRGQRQDWSDGCRRAWLGVLNADRAGSPSRHPTLLGCEEPASGSQPDGSC